MPFEMPYFPFYPADFLLDGKCAVMTLEQVGAYIKLLCYQWREGEIPSDPTQIATLLGADSQAIARLMPGLQVCFPNNQNRRLEEIRNGLINRSIKLSEAGKRRWNKKLIGHSQAIARLKPGLSTRACKSESESDTNIKKPPTPFDFETLWLKYPKDKDGLRKGKKEATAHFRATVKTDQDWIDINRAIEKYSKSSTVLGGYVKNGSSWFNNWRDFVPTPEKEKAVFKPKPNPCRTCGQPATLNGLCQKCNDAPLSPQEREEFEKAKKDLPKLLSQIGKPMPSAQGMRPEVQKALEEERKKR